MDFLPLGVLPFLGVHLGLLLLFLDTVLVLLTGLALEAMEVTAFFMTFSSFSFSLLLSLSSLTMFWMETPPRMSLIRGAERSDELE